MADENVLKGTILIVEDNEANRGLLATLLQRSGHTVIMAENGVEALKLMREQNPDVVLLDIMMPKMDGYQVLDNMKQDPELRDMPVLVISAVDDMDSVVKCIELGADDYLYKPIKRILLTARVEACLAKRHWRQRELERLTELNSLKDQFVRTVSHELKNPIMMIMGFVEILSEMTAEEIAESKDYLERIGHHTQQMQDLIEDLLDLSKLETGPVLTFVDTPLSDLLNGGVESFKLVAERKNIKIECAPILQEISLHIDVERIRRVLQNLLSNAVKYTNESGSIKLTAEIADNEVVVCIADTGSGIPEEDIAQIFDQFYRVDRHREIEGTGLGLAIVKAIIEQHKGKIWVESVLDEGSRFYFSLPLQIPVSSS
jgi:signal transduction histidine kinase